MIGLDGLDSGLRLPREEVCKRHEEIKKRDKNQESARPRSAAQRKKTKRLTINDVFDLVEAGGQHRLLVRPGRALTRKLGQEGGFCLFRLPLRLRKQPTLLCQLSGQQITHCGELAALLPFGAQCGVGFAQLLLKSSVGS